MRFQNKQALIKFLISQNIKTTYELLSSFSLKFQKNEYAIHHIYSNKGYQFRVTTYWYGLYESEKRITRHEFIEALKNTIDSKSFSVNLKPIKRYLKTVVY